MSSFPSTNQERSHYKDPATWEEGKSRLQQTQEEVEQVTMIMLDNKKKAAERFDNLKDLEHQAEDLLEKSKTFEKTTNKLKKQKEMSSKKKTIISLSVVAGLIILGLIIFVILTFAG